MPQSTQERSSSAADSFKAVPNIAWLAIGAVVLIVAAVLIFVLSNSSSSGEKTELTGNGYPGNDVSNTRFVEGEINSGNANSLKEAWSLPLSAKSTYGAYSATPVIANGAVYSQDLASNVQAIDLESGEVQWTKNYEELDQGPNGVVVSGGKVFGATPTKAFALDQESGEEVWSTPLTRGPNEAIDMAPGYHEGLVYVSTVPTLLNSEYPPGGVGVLWALDADTGKKVWHFNTVPESLWSKKNSELNSGGGLWYPPSFDKAGNLYAGTGNPAPLPGTAKEPYGSSRPGPNLYADSMVKLDPKTGKLLWYYQETPHNIYDWDFQNSPIITKAGGKEVAIGSGKSGFVVAADVKTGKPVWRTSVGKHNGHDNDNIYAMKGEYDKIKPGEVFPGAIGGVVALAAADDKRIYVPIVNHSLTLVNGGETSEESAATGEVAALDLKTGKVLWTFQTGQPAYGSLVVSNDVVFATTADGVVHALDSAKGGELWQAALPSGTNAGVMISGDMLVAGAGLPAVEGQQPKLVAYKIGG